ncbi:MAG: carbohydrate kinase [Clostridia bacterium]|nr:carbohydrate kinase [Clostridia bacterium]
MKILSFGEILWDIYPDKKYIGGAPLNFAAHLAKHGEDVYMLSSLGKDHLGKEALAKLKKWNINTDYVKICDKKDTGKCLVTLDENAVPSYDLIQDAAYDYIDCDNIDKEFDVLYFGTLALRNKYNMDSLSKLLKDKSFNDIFVDINIRTPFYSCESVVFCLKNATILKISLEELPIIADLLSLDNTIEYNEFVRILKGKYSNLKTIIVTLGADGAYCYECKRDDEYRCESEKIKIASTVGAGDSFSAAFLYQYFKKTDIQLCLKYAAKIAGYVVSQYDAVPDYNVNDFL